jgi:hypothetical protein
MSLLLSRPEGGFSEALEGFLVFLVREGLADAGGVCAAGLGASALK